MLIPRFGSSILLRGNSALSCNVSSHDVKDPDGFGAKPVSHPVASGNYSGKYIISWFNGNTSVDFPTIGALQESVGLSVCKVYGPINLLLENED